jgi:hypothetical protein
MQEEVRAKISKYQRQTPVKTVDSSTSTPQPQVEVRIKKYLKCFLLLSKEVYCKYITVFYSLYLTVIYRC